MGRTVLIDADITAYQVAATQEQEFTFGDQKVYHTDIDQAIDEVNNLIEWIIETTDSDQAALFLTGTNNFRKEVLPTYKANRTGVRKPEGLSAIREHIAALPLSFMEDNLEGDDLIGIHATKPHKGERVIFSIDKDLKTVPGLHWCPEDGEIIEVIESNADRFFFTQVLTGDAVDNYKGCPRIGPVKAERILEGLTTNEERWEAVVGAYENAGLTEEDALQQARCARILRHGDYDFETKKVKLWDPETTKSTKTATT